MACSLPKRFKRKSKKGGKIKNEQQKHGAAHWYSSSKQQPYSRCAPVNTANVSKSHAAASLLQAATYGLRASLAEQSDQGVKGGAANLDRRRLLPLPAR